MLQQYQYLILAAIVVIIIVALNRGKGNGKSAAVPGSWIIGPIYAGENLSKNLPERTIGVLELSTPVQEPHYVFQKLPLLDKSEIEITVTVSAVPGSFIPIHGGESYEATPSVSLFIQRFGDDWRSPGFRWFAGTVDLVPGVHTLRAGLSYDEWKDVLGGGTELDFQATLDMPIAVGVFFGGPEGRGHGIRATSPAKIELKLSVK
jgi:hypothetical protein